MHVIRILSGAELQAVVRNVRLVGNDNLFPYASSEVALSVLEIDKLVPLAKYVLEENLQLLSELGKHLSYGGLDLLNLPGRVELDVSGTSNFVAPPVIEEWPGEGLLIVDGLHRIWTGRQCGAKSVRCILIRNIEFPLVPLPVRWKDVQKYPPGVRLRKKDKRDYRFETMESLEGRFKKANWGITASNVRYFFFRDLSPLGSSGERTFANPGTGG